MYKCKECGAEFEEKPDFCDCGNDEFDFVSGKESTEASAHEKQIRTEKQDQKTESNIKVIPKVKKTETKKSFNEHYPEFERFKKALDPISTTIFTLCIILSFYVLFFAWNPKEDMAEETGQKSPEVVKTIPPIDKFWNSTPPKIIEVKPVQDVKPELQTPPIQNSPKPIKQSVKHAAKLATALQKPKTTSVKLIKNPQISTVEQARAQEKTKLEAAKKAKQAAEQKAKQEAELKAKQAAELKAKQAAEHNAQQQAISKQELNNYKAGLRNTLGRKIDFTRVVGDGECTVSFKLNSSGNLVNRSFTKQSSNITLNDAVYQAIMSTPTYNPPPVGYKNETLSLNIRFYNGNFEISLK